MDAEERQRKQQGLRLRGARKSARYKSARDAALSNGWKESTYRAHEAGTRTIGQDDAEKYAKRFANISARQILFGDDPTPPAPSVGRGDLSPKALRFLEEFEGLDQSQQNAVRSVIDAMKFVSAQRKS